MGWLYCWYLVNKIKEYILTNNPKSAVIVGTGFIGVEMIENIKNLEIEVTNDAGFLRTLSSYFYV